MLHLYFVCGNISLTLTSLNMENANTPLTQHQSLSLAPTLSLAVSVYAFLKKKKTSYNTKDHQCFQFRCMCDHMDVHIGSHALFLSHSPCHVETKMISHSKETATVKKCLTKMES